VDGITGSSTASGVAGINKWFGVGVYGIGHTGVYGTTYPYFYGTGVFGSGYYGGVMGEATNQPGPGLGYAGYFCGDVPITGNFVEGRRYVQNRPPPRSRPQISL